MVNGNYAPTIGFNILDNTTPSWKLGLHGSSHHNFALSSGTGNTNKLIVQSTSNGGKGLFYGDWFATNLSMASTLYHDGDTDTGLTFDTDTINLHTGNTTRLSITNSGESITGDLSVSGVSTFVGIITASATENIIPFLYSNYSDLPAASSYHGAFAHVHSVGKAFFAHAGAWMEIVSKETNGTVGTGTERYNVGCLLYTSPSPRD